MNMYLMTCMYLHVPSAYMCMCFVTYVCVQTYTHMEIMRWVLVCIIGILTGVVAFGIDMGVKQLFRLKYYYFEEG